MLWLASAEHQLINLVIQLIAKLKIDTHEQARGSLTIQASLDLKLGEYNLKNGRNPSPLHSPTCKHMGLCPSGFR